MLFFCLSILIFAVFPAIVGEILAILTAFCKELHEAPFAEYVLEVDADWLAKKLIVCKNLTIAALRRHS